MQSCPRPNNIILQSDDLTDAVPRTALCPVCRTEVDAGFLERYKSRYHRLRSGKLTTAKMLTGAEPALPTASACHRRNDHWPCEEAGEVLEAHTITALLSHIEHSILIGHHQQLRPQTQNHELQHKNPHGEKYFPDVSLFKRLVQPKGD